MHAFAAKSVEVKGWVGFNEISLTKAKYIMADGFLLSFAFKWKPKFKRVAPVQARLRIKY